MKKFSLFVLFFLGAILSYSFWPETEIRHSPGVLAPDEPIQVNIQNGKSWDKGDYKITPLAEFKVKARVLSKENYWMGRETEVSPTDLALGWGQMSDQSVLDMLEIDQGNRWFHWTAKNLPIPASEISSHASNMHIVPANDEIEDILGDVEKGHLIELKGYLIRINAEDGWRWESSLSRKDTRGGACEVVWVDSLLILE